jgi:hypothetical protein
MLMTKLLVLVDSLQQIISLQQMLSLDLQTPQTIHLIKGMQQFISLKEALMMITKGVHKQ